MIISIIVAVDKNNAIGINNKLPWNLPADLKYFKEKTLGKTVIMGQKTFESIGKPLPGRNNIVMSLDHNFHPLGCITVRSINDALEKGKNNNEVMIAGGLSIYKQFLPLANKIYLTLIDYQFEADTFFPEINMSQWQEISREKHQSDDKNKYDYTFLILERKNKTFLF